MANGIVSPATTPTTGFDYEAYRKKIQETAAKTRDVAGISPETKSQLTTAATQVQPIAGHQRVAQSLVSQLGQQEADVKARAEKAATGLEMVGESTLQGMQNLERIQSTLRQRVQDTSGAWGEAPEKADEYVQAARSRVGEVLTKLDDIFKDMNESRDFSKAHAMQASVQATIGSMRAEERNIVETYGTESKEYDQFRMSKTNALATVQSNLHASYANLEEQQRQNYMNVVSEAYTKSNMYVGFQEQQHVEMLKYKAEAQNAYNIQASQMDASIEQMKMSGMENLANWMIETPTFSMDVTPIVAMIADLGVQAQSLYDTHKYMKRQSKRGGLTASFMQGLGGGLAGGIGGGIGQFTGSLFQK